jgi:hypothetical protein
MRRSFSERIKKAEEKLGPLPMWDTSQAGIFTVEYPDGSEEVIRIDWPYGGRIYVSEDGRVHVSEDTPVEEGVEIFELPKLLLPCSQFWRKIAGKIKGL